MQEETRLHSEDRDVGELLACNSSWARIGRPLVRPVLDGGVVKHGLSKPAVLEATIGLFSAVAM